MRNMSLPLPSSIRVPRPIIWLKRSGDCNSTTEAAGPAMMIGPKREYLAAGQYRAKVCFTQDSSDLRALVTLNFDLAVLHSASSAAGLLHGLGEFFLFRKTNADKILNY